MTSAGGLNPERERRGELHFSMLRGCWLISIRRPSGSKRRQRCRLAEPRHSCEGPNKARHSRVYALLFGPHAHPRTCGVKANISEVPVLKPVGLGSPQL